MRKKKSYTKVTHYLIIWLAWQCLKPQQVSRRATYFFSFLYAIKKLHINNMTKSSQPSSVWKPIYQEQETTAGCISVKIWITQGKEIKWTDVERREPKSCTQNGGNSWAMLEVRRNEWQGNGRKRVENWPMKRWDRDERVVRNEVVSIGGNVTQTMCAPWAFTFYIFPIVRHQTHCSLSLASISQHCALDVYC